MDPTFCVRIAMLLISSYCCFVCCTSPTPPASEEEQQKYDAEYKKPDPVVIRMRTLTELYKVSVVRATVVSLSSCAIYPT